MLIENSDVNVCGSLVVVYQKNNGHEDYSIQSEWKRINRTENIQHWFTENVINQFTNKLIEFQSHILDIS